MPPSLSSVRNFLLQQELPDNALHKAQNSLKSLEQQERYEDGSVSTTYDGCCPCPHWRNYLPHRLDLSFCEIAKFESEKEEHGPPLKDAPRTAWVMKHPVHALHLQSLLDRPPDSFYSDEAPVLFGDEQERLLALKTEGLAESWHPWIEPSDSAPMALIANSQHPRAASTSSSDGNRAAKAPAATAVATAENDSKTINTNTAGVAPYSSSGVSDSVTSTSAPVAGASAEASNSTPAPAAGAPSESSNNTPAPAAGAPSESSNNTPSPPSLADTNIAKCKATSASNLPLSASPMEAPPALAALVAPTNALPSPTLPTISSSNSTVVVTAAASEVSSAATAPTPDEMTQTSSKHEQQQSKCRYLVPEDTYSSWHTAEEQIRLIRRTFLSKRHVTLPVKRKSKSGTKVSETTPTSKVDKKRKTDSNPGGGGSSLQAMMSVWKLPKEKHHHHPLPPIDSSSDEGNNVNDPQAFHPPLKSCITLDSYEAQQHRAERTVQLWMEHYRWNRMAYWRERKHQQQRQTRHSLSMAQPKSSTALFRSELTSSFVFGTISRGSTKKTSAADVASASFRRCCQECRRLRSGVSQSQRDGREWLTGGSGNEEEDDDDYPNANDDDLLFQCLECSFIGCAPASVARGKRTLQHMTLHFLQSNHKFAVSCGRQAQIYCFECGDFVYHPIFDQEKERIDLTERLPWQAWKEHAVQRSFDAVRFFRVQDQGIFWRGVYATYPPLVPLEHVRAARICLNRQRLFSGQVDELPFLRANQRPDVMQFAARQQAIVSRNRWKVPAPVGMYNLGNTCFMSSILQCLVHSVPLQRYFLKDIGHNHEACLIYRKKSTGKQGGSHADSSKSKKTTPETICLACEMDKLFLCYMGSATGVDVVAAVSSNEGNRSSTSNSSTGNSGSTAVSVDGTVVQGDPLVIATMLSTAWKCVAMKHLAGYGQRDAHEFLHGFLEIMGRHMQLYRTRMFKAINMARPLNSFVDVTGEHSSQYDEVRSLFEGTLRSILVCRECGAKRTQSESFLSISLPLSKEVQMAASSPNTVNEKLSVELCLRHFTMPELLADPVDCPSCGKKTQTKKQHVVSKLPKILCLHLKRFDAAQNKKIEDFVAFPSRGLNMGLYLPHWCEVSRVPTEMDFVVTDDATVPEIAYDLFGTVNHYGSLQSGHYVANVKVNERWYHCNDAHVFYAGVGNGEAEVLKSGAYLLFYERR